MKLIKIAILILFMFSLVAGCGKETKNGEVSIAPEVIVNLPSDNTVNGYKNPSSIDNSDKISASDVKVGLQSSEKNNNKNYCGNKNSKVFHDMDCESVKKMKDENKVFASDKKELTNKGYKPCGSCKP